MTPRAFESRYGPDASFCDWLHAGYSLRQWERDNPKPVPKQQPFVWREPGLYLPLSCAPYSIVASASAPAASLFGSGTTGAIDTTGSDLLVAAVVGFNASSSVSDSAGNTWTGLNTYASTNVSVQLFYVRMPSTSAAHTFTVAANTAVAICVVAFSGAGSATGFVDGQSGSANNSAGSIQPGSVTPSQSGDLAVTCISNGTSGWSIDSGFTIQQTVVGVGGVNLSLVLAWKVLSASAENPTWTIGGTDQLATGMAFFLGVPAAGGQVSSRLARLGVH